MAKRDSLVDYVYSDGSVTSNPLDLGGQGPQLVLAYKNGQDKGLLTIKFYQQPGPEALETITASAAVDRTARKVLEWVRENAHFRDGQYRSEDETVKYLGDIQK